MAGVEYCKQDHQLSPKTEGLYNHIPYYVGKHPFESGPQRFFNHAILSAEKFKGQLLNCPAHRTNSG